MESTFIYYLLIVVYRKGSTASFFVYVKLVDNLVDLTKVLIIKSILSNRNMVI